MAIVQTRKEHTKRSCWGVCVESKSQKKGQENVQNMPMSESSIAKVEKHSPIKNSPQYFNNWEHAMCILRNPAENS